MSCFFFQDIFGVPSGRVLWYLEFSITITVLWMSLASKTTNNITIQATKILCIKHSMIILSLFATFKNIKGIPYKMRFGIFWLLFLLDKRKCLVFVNDCISKEKNLPLFIAFTFRYCSSLGLNSELSWRW